MFNRPINYVNQIWRLFDFLWAWKDMIMGFGELMTVLFGATTTLVSGFAATAQVTPNMTVNLAAGRICKLDAIDATPFGGLPSDATQVYMMGVAAAQVLTFNTSGLSSGQSKWALVQCTFQQTDAVRSGDPTGGVLAFWNSADPTNPLNGQGGLGGVLPTVRKGVAAVSILYGNPATTGTEVPPTATAGYAPMYLVNIAFGQTAITQGQIQTAGPAAYAGYAVAPFSGGLYSQHHKGGAGQAPKIDVTQEISGIVPFANLLTTGALGKIAMIRSGASTPNGNVAGEVDDFYWQTGSNVLWRCQTAGSTSTAVWAPSGPIGPTTISAFPATITQTSGVVLLNLSGDAAVTMPAANLNCDLVIARIDGNPAYKATLQVAGSPGGQTIMGASSYEITGGNDSIRAISRTSDLTWWVIGGFFG